MYPVGLESKYAYAIVSDFLLGYPGIVIWVVAFFLLLSPIKDMLNHLSFSPGQHDSKRYSKWETYFKVLTGINDARAKMAIGLFIPRWA